MLALSLWVVSWLDSALTNRSVATWMLDSQDEPPPQCSSHLHTKANINNNNTCKDSNSHNSSQHSNSLEHLADIFPFSNDDANNNANNHNNGSPEHPADNLPFLDGDPNNSTKATNTADKASNTNQDADTDTSSSTSPFPQNEKTIKADDELVLICQYLSDPRSPPHLHGDVLTHFVHRTTCFSLANSRLWRWQPNR